MIVTRKPIHLKNIEKFGAKGCANFTGVCCLSGACCNGGQFER